MKQLRFCRDLIETEFEISGSVTLKERERERQRSVKELLFLSIESFVVQALNGDRMKMCFLKKTMIYINGVII